ncbi:MAG: hypothetical protein Q8Q37_01515 [bacterium]|nr:hypothetical protein [bacterium]
MKISFLKRYVLPIILTASLLSGYVANAQTVYVAGGQVNTNEINPVMTNAAISNIGDFNQNLFEWGQTFVLETLKKRVLDMMVDQIIQWVQGGGEPKFITDWGSFLRDAGQQAVGDFAQELGLGFLCEPFSFQIQIALQNPSPFSQRASCTLDEIVGNIENFYQNFENGGWIAYSESWKPRNNYYGSLIMAYDEQQNRRESAESAAWSEGIAGGGFLSTKDANGNISTPGSVIGATVAKAIGSDIDYIVNAQQLQEYIAAISDAVINRLIKEGINGLQNVNTDNAPSSGYVVSSANQTGTACAGLTSSALQSCLQYNQATTDSFNASKNAILTQIDLTLLPRVAAQNSLTSALNDLYSFASTATEIYENLIILEKDPNAPIALCFKPKNQLLQEIASAIAEENNQLTDLQSQYDTNQAIIDELVAIKNQILLIPQDDWNSLGAISGSVQSKLDPVTAENLKRSAATTRNQVRNQTTALLNSFNLQITRCYE